MDNNDPLQNPKTFLKTIIVIHAALMVGQLLFAVLAFAMTKNPVFNTKPGDGFFYIAPLLALTGIITGSFLYKQRLKNLDNKSSLKEKLRGYQAAFITRCALAEGPSLFGIVVYIITGNLFFLLISGLIVLYFLLIKPTKDKVADDLNLSYEEKMEI